MAVTLVNVADPTQPVDDLETPQAGSRLVGVQLRLTNTGSAIYQDAPDNSATLVDQFGQSFPTTFVSQITAGPVFPAGVTVAAGDSGLGYVVFAVPAGSTPARLQFTLDSGFAGQTGQWQLPATSATPSNSPPQTATPASPPSPAPAPTTDPASVVRGYFAAINAGDYQTAWSLGGRNLDSSYDHFVAGFADTSSDTVTIVSSQDDTVEIELDAAQTDGSHRYYAGTYTVQDGAITAADISER